jgi:hypothetical protein
VSRIVAGSDSAISTWSRSRDSLLSIDDHGRHVFTRRRRRRRSIFELRLGGPREQLEPGGDNARRRVRHVESSPRSDATESSRTNAVPGRCSGRSRGD